MASKVKVEVGNEADALRDLEKRGIIEIEWLDPEGIAAIAHAKPVDVKELLYRAAVLGFVIEQKFMDEDAYTLLTNPRTREYMRIYDNGRVLKTDQSGRYVEIPDWE